MRSVATVLLVGLLIFSAFSQIQPVGNAGSVDWNRRVVAVTGIGAPPEGGSPGSKRPNALRVAWADAMRKSLETVKGICVDANTTVENAMVASDVINTRVSGYVRTFKQIGEPKYFEDQSVEVAYEVIIGKEIIDAVLPQTVGASPAVTAMPSVSIPKTVYTGLIVDCKGQSVTPAIAPKIFDEGDHEVYGSAYVSRDWAVKHGMVGYAKSVEQASKLKDRIGATPGVVKALRAKGPNKTDVVLAKKDADSVRSASENLKFLAECRVIFVVD